MSIILEGVLDQKIEKWRRNWDILSMIIEPWKRITPETAILKRLYF